MRILAFETSAKAASVALLQDGNLLGEYMQNSGQTHSRTLMKMAEDLLRNCDLQAHDIDAVACAAGPGSFTGVRIGVAAAKGYAWGRQLPCYGVSTLEAMARNVAVSDGMYCAAYQIHERIITFLKFLFPNKSLITVLNGIISVFSFSAGSSFFISISEIKLHMFTTIIAVAVNKNPVSSLPIASNLSNI